jgi:hypothetical protein
MDHSLGRLRTGKITKAQICQVPAADLQRNTIHGEAQLIVIEILVVAAQKRLGRDRGIENRPLCPSKTFFNLTLLRYGLSKNYGFWGAERLAVFSDSEPE